MGWGAFLSSSTAICNDEKHDQYDSEANQERCPIIYRVIVIGTRSSREGLGGFIDDNKEAVLALGTLLIALFTLTLKQSTDRLWAATREIGERQSAETKILERARLVVVPLGPSLTQKRFKHYRYGGNHVDRWLYMWGCVYYEDGFGFPRFTRFCIRYNLYGADRSCRVSAEHARYHQNGNYTDETPPDKRK
jgi:hypothetical protein